MSNNAYYENSNLWGNRELTLLQRQVLRMLVALCLELPEGAKIADLGCGDGIILNTLMQRFPLHRGYGVDFSEEALKYIQPPQIAQVSDLAELPYEDGYFDLCFCIDVLEHIPPSKLQKVTDEIHRVCKGPVFMVSPYLESDAIRTVCPDCECVFSPYYHVNRFTQDKWEGLIRSQLSSRDFCFVPLGKDKANIPLGIGATMVAWGAYVTHHHDTLCPQCGTRFHHKTNNSPDNLISLLSPIALYNRDEFGWVYEEMGILTFPKGDNCTKNINQELTIIESSCYKIDFKDNFFIRDGLDYFRSPGYVVNDENIQIIPGEGIRWLQTDLNFKPLRIALPPGDKKKCLRLKLRGSVCTSGILSAKLYANPPSQQIDIGWWGIDPKAVPFNIDLEIPAHDSSVTPFGLLLELLWEPNEKNSVGNEVVLYELIDTEVPTRNVRVLGDLDKYDISTNLSYNISLNENSRALRYRYKGRIFDLSGHLSGDYSEKIPIPIADQKLPKTSVYSQVFPSALNKQLIDSEIRAIKKQNNIQQQLNELKKTLDMKELEIQEVTTELSYSKQNELRMEQEIQRLEDERIQLRKRLEELLDKLKEIKLKFETSQIEINYLSKRIKGIQSTKGLLQRFFREKR